MRLWRLKLLKPSNWNIRLWSNDLLSKRKPAKYSRCSKWQKYRMVRNFGIFWVIVAVFKMTNARSETGHEAFYIDLLKYLPLVTFSRVIEPRDTTYRFILLCDYAVRFAAVAAASGEVEIPSLHLVGRRRWIIRVWTCVRDVGLQSQVYRRSCLQSTVRRWWACCTYLPSAWVPPRSSAEE